MKALLQMENRVVFSHSRFCSPNGDNDHSYSHSYHHDTFCNRAPPCPSWPDIRVLVHLVGLRFMDMSSSINSGGRYFTRLDPCIHVFRIALDNIRADFSESYPLYIESDHTPFPLVVLCRLVPRDHGGGSGLNAAGNSSCAEADCGNAR